MPTQTFTPQPSFTISLDLELHWGVFDKRSIASYRENLNGTRAAVHAILGAFAEFDVHATWATVGLLMCSSKHEALRYAPSSELRPAYKNAELDPYKLLHELSNHDEPYYFAPELIEAIQAVPNQEIATHTFGHLYALEQGMSEKVWDADLTAACRIAETHGVTMKSIVFPRNQWSSSILDVCALHGIRTFRGQPPSRIYAPRPDSDQALPIRAARLLDAYLPVTHRPTQVTDERGLKNVAATAFLRPYAPKLRALEVLRTRRLIQDMLLAVQRGQNVHIWWHPHNFGANLEENLAMLRQLLRFASNLRERGLLQFTTMDATAWP